MDISTLPLEVIFKIIHHLPQKNIGHLIDLPVIGDHAFKEYYSDVVIESNMNSRYQMDRAQFIPEDPTLNNYNYGTSDLSFIKGNPYVPPKEAAFGGVNSFINFLKLNGDKYIPGSISVEESSALLKESDLFFLHQQYPEVLKLAKLVLTVQKSRSEDILLYEQRIKEFFELPYNITEVSYYSFPSVRFPKTLKHLGCISGSVGPSEEYFPKDLQSLVLEDVFMSDRNLSNLPISLTKLSFEIVVVTSKIKLNLPNLKKLKVTDSVDSSDCIFDFFNLSQLTELQLEVFKTSSLESVRFPPGLKDLSLTRLRSLKDLVGVNLLINLNCLILEGTLEILEYEFPENLRKLVVDLGNPPSTTPKEILILDLTNFKLPRKLVSLTVQNSDYVSISNIDLPSSLKYLVINYVHVVDWLELPNSLLGLKLNTNGGIKSLENRILPEALIELDLESNQLQEIRLQKLPNLEFLNLLGNTISTIHELPPNLKFLDLHLNQLRTFDGLELVNLKRLDLYRNRFEGTVTNETMYFPQALESLNLQFNKITLFHEEFKFPSTLKSVSLLENPFTSSIYHSIPSYLEILHAGKGTTTCDDFKFPNLKYIGFTTFDYNPFNMVSFNMCTNLQTFYLFGMELPSLDWDQFPVSLVDVSANACEICKLEGSLQRLLNLQSIELESNQLGEYLRENVLELPDSLVTLAISDNGITKLAGITPGKSSRAVRICENDDLEIGSLLELCKGMGQCNRVYYDDERLEFQVFVDKGVLFLV